MSKIDRVADILAEASAALRTHGVAMVAVATDWQRGPAAANLDPDHGGWRYQPCGDVACAHCPHPVPSDPTGEATLRDDPASHYLGELVALQTGLERSARRLVALAGILVPNQPQKPNTLKAQHAAGADVAREGWCRSCWRDDQTCTPIETHADGTPYYRDRCRWCGSFLSTHQVDPPLSILRLHHDGRRISERDVARALARGKAA